MYDTAFYFVSYHMESYICNVIRTYTKWWSQSIKLLALVYLSYKVYSIYITIFYITHELL
jgi:hypothetical protein